MSARILLGAKTAGKGDDLTSFIVSIVMKNPEALTFRIPKGLFRHVAGKLYLYLLTSSLCPAACYYVCVCAHTHTHTHLDHGGTPGVVIFEMMASTVHLKDRDQNQSSRCIYLLWNGRFRVRILVISKRIFSTAVRTGFWADLAPCRIGTRFLSLGVGQPDSGVEHPPPFSGPLPHLLPRLSMSRTLSELPDVFRTSRNVTT